MPGNGPASPCLESKNATMSILSAGTIAVTIVSPHSESPRTPQKPPLVTVHSPPESVRSPPRSPRLSGLLHALKDVIGEEPEYPLEEESTYVEEPLKGGDASDYTTVIDIPHSLPIVEQSPTESSGSTLAVDSGLLFHEENETLRLPEQTIPATEPQPTIHTIQSSPGASTPPNPPSDLLSPVDLAYLHLSSFNQDDLEANVLEDDPIDSDQVASQKPNPRSSGSQLYSTFGVLSSPFATASSRVLSPRLSAFISRAPSPFAPAPVIENDDVPSDVSLDSPAGHSVTRTEPQPEPSEEYVVVESGIAITTDVVFEEEYSAEEEADKELGSEPERDSAEPGSEEEEDSSDVETDGGDGDNTNAGNSSAALWDHNGDPTAVYLGMPQVTPQEVHDALRHATMTPVHFLANTIEFDEGEAVANSSIELPFDESDMAGNSSVMGFDHTVANVSSSSSLDVEAPDESYITDSFEGEAITNSSMELPFDESDMSGNSSAMEFDHTKINDSSSLDVEVPDDSYNADSFDPPNSSTDVHPPMYSSFSSLSSGDPEDDDADFDKTAQLAYLHSPTIAFNENDTLHSLYDQYYDFPEEETEEDDNSPLENIAEIPVEDDLEEDEIESPLVVDNESPVMESPLVTPLDESLLDTAEIESLSSATPVTSDFIRERVFTPPPHMPVTRGRSGTIVAADSPRSMPTPPMPFALPHTRPSPGSAWSPDSATSEVQEAVVSKKVAFGFRKSIGRIDASILASHRLSKRDSQAVRPPPVAHVPRAGPPENSSPTSAPATGLRPLRLLSSITISEVRLKSVMTKLLSTRASVIPEHVRNTHDTTDDIPSPLSSIHIRRLTTFSTIDDDSPRSAPLSRPLSWQSNPAADLSDMSEFTQNEYTFDRPFSRASEPSYIYEDEDEQNDTLQDDQEDHVIRRALPIVPHSAPVDDRRASVARPPVFAIATPKPTLMFAIASDDVKQVRRVLESGDTGPNDTVGPQSALAFALTNEQLTHKMEIVKTLLAYGADPKAVIQPARGSSSPDGAQSSADPVSSPSPHPSLMNALDPATRYYVERADAPHTRRTSALIHRSFFRPLTRVRYELIGQDRALEQLFKDLSMHSRQLSVTPIVVLLCGPSGHGKSLLARKFGTLLDVPTHTVDMTTIHSAQDLWKSYSMSPYDPPSTRSLAEFLCDNEGKRCVVVLDEIEKTHGESPLWALLMPWEHGRCTFEANGRLVDVRNVVWLGTSNIGQDLVFEHHNARALPDELMSKGEYTELMALLRPRVSERLGTSILSRVTTALPFVPFTPEERRAICYEALHTIAGDIVQTLSANVVDTMVKGALADYTAAEGARSLYRAVSNQLVENI
ncbi:hypothetical protein DXG01_013482 [Tephrocybe rancida]|nr:hypothetical protein DXG01_013482 [Tephrocybe rancida]